MKKIGEILKNSREDLEMTQIEVKKITGINNKTLSGYENGISEPDLETFAKLCSLYNLSADEILEINNQRDSFCCCDSNEQKLLTLYRNLDTLRQKDVLSVMQALIKNNK